MKKSRYSHIFFDLDHTLWDFDANNLITFDEILSKHKLYHQGIQDVSTFMKAYSHHNKALWDQYKNGEIEKSFLSYSRFHLTLKEFGIDNLALSKAMAQDYIVISPTKTILREGAIEVLAYLKPLYFLGLITNGFDEIQYIKIREAGLEPFFQMVVTSEQAGSKKPDPGIFRFALQQIAANASTSLYVGDEPETDVVGARNAGIDQVLVTFGKGFHNEGATYTISSLIELKSFL
jgi:putative hydrolase of the HAD superfamily